MDSIIVCPSCGAEYLPAEIFYPDEFLGSPSDIKKDGKGKVVFYKGKNMCVTETYVCDYCHRKMYLNAKITFDASVQPFTNGYITTFKKTNLFMEEN